MARLIPEPSATWAELPCIHLFPGISTGDIVMPLIMLTCSYTPCSAPFLVKPYLARDGQPHYCSRACRGLSQRVTYTPEEKRAYQAAAMRKHRAQFTPEEMRAKWLAEYYGNHEARLASSARYKAENLEAVQAQQRAHKKAWGAENKDIIRQRNLRYYEQNTAKVQAQTAAYQRNNPEKVVAFQERRRAKKAATRNDFTAEQWLELLEVFDHRCAYCHKKSDSLEMEHVTPISKGGPHTVSNIVPACIRCNRKKHAGPPPVPVQPLLLTLAPSQEIRPRKNRKKP